MFILDKIDKNFIFTHLTEEQIFERYLGYKPNTRDLFTNTIRDDDSEGCSFYVDSRGVLKFHDFAMGWNWDCFNLVQHIYKCNYYEACELIARDFGLRDERYWNYRKLPERSSVKKEEVNIRVKKREWTKKDVAFWNIGGLTVTKEELEERDIYPLAKAWINNFEVFSWRGEESFVYEFGGYDYKIYLPTHRPKFYHNNGKLIQGLAHIPYKGEHIVITKSYKDCFFLSKFGIPAIAPMSESIVLTPEQIRKLSDRFDFVSCLYDTDKRGVTSTKAYKKLGVIPLLFPRHGPKDFADNLKEYGYQYMIDLIEDTKQRILPF